MNIKNDLTKIKLPKDIRTLLNECPNYMVADNIEQLVELSYKDSDQSGWHSVGYDVDGEEIEEARVCKVRNGVAANFVEPYMRRRDPDCMYIADELPTDKVRFEDKFNCKFSKIRQETFDWLKKQDLCIFFFNAGPDELGMNACAVAPVNAAFFALGLAMLQGIIDTGEVENNKNKFEPESVIYVAPPFRHTHFDGKQVVVHHRDTKVYEMFSYNLYPGPSAKKGVYGMLIDQGEEKKWPTLHCSTVQVVTPYDNRITITHEGASGGGKSEMLEGMHRQRDGRLLLGKNLNKDEKRILTLPQGCELRPVADDMASAHNSIQKDDGKLALKDAENAWFIRVDAFDGYGTDPHLEELTCHPDSPLLFLNIDAQPKSTALIWEHIHDEPGVRCPNPRVVFPRKSMPNIINDEVTVDIRSFGVRTPPCTRDNPSYGIMGLFHVLPPALAWLWRLVSPRGYGNPSINETEGMSSEGVGSFWPFAPGKRITQANILLEQIIETPKVRYILIPNQHIGVWKVGFMPEWLTREYLARRGGAWFTKKQIMPARSSLLGYALKEIIVEGQQLEKEFLQVEHQEEVGPEAYDMGDEILQNFFKEHLKKFLGDELNPRGQKIIECFFDRGTLENYNSLIESDPIIKNN